MQGFLVALLVSFSLGQKPPDIHSVVRRAMDYVAAYEAALGNLIGTENYLQRVAWSSGKTETRITSSDYLIVRVGPKWMGVRDVNTVDGSPVPKNRKGFESAFGTSPSGNLSLLNSMKADSAQYNIGDILRDTNLPTFTLQVLEKDQAPRFAFKKMGTETIGNVETWQVRFEEKKGSTLVRNTRGENLFSTGTLWIDPENGRVLKTEFLLTNKVVKPPIVSRMTVTYVEGAKLSMLVPETMFESYLTRNFSIDCRADYLDFRSFQVDVQFDFNSPKPLE